MTIFTLPICLPVETFFNEAEAEDFGYKDAKQFAFDRAMQAEDAPTKCLTDWATDAGLTISVTGVEFDEFDAGNLSHAGAHYIVTFEADPATADALAVYAYGDTDCLVGA